jgi:hypothetical protein
MADSTLTMLAGFDAPGATGRASEDGLIERLR